MVFQARLLGVRSQVRVTSQHREGESDLSQDAFEGSDFGAEAQMCIHSLQAG